MKYAGGRVEADILIGKDPRLTPSACITPFDLKHVIYMKVRAGCTPYNANIRISSSLPVTCFPKARSSAWGIVEGKRVLVICRQEASSLPGQEDCGLTPAEGDDDTIAGAMFVHMPFANSSKGLRPYSSHQLLPEYVNQVYISTAE